MRSCPWNLCTCLKTRGQYLSHANPSVSSLHIGPLCGDCGQERHAAINQPKLCTQLGRGTPGQQRNAFFGDHLRCDAKHLSSMGAHTRLASRSVSHGRSTGARTRITERPCPCPSRSDASIGFSPCSRTRTICSQDSGTRTRCGRGSHPPCGQGTHAWRCGAWLAFVRHCACELDGRVARLRNSKCCTCCHRGGV